MTATVTWLPSGWMDEIIPETQDHPDRFILRDGDAFFLAPVDEHGDAPVDRHWCQPLADGEIVTFYAHESYGCHEIEVAADRTWSGGHSIPAKANNFCAGSDFDTIGDSIGEVLEDIDSLDGPVAPGPMTIGAWWWSNDEAHYRFHATPAPHFELVKPLGAEAQA